MNLRQVNALGISMNCLERMMRFVAGEMEPDEVMTFAAHYQDCFECRDYARNLRGMLDWREGIHPKLNKKEELRSA